MNNKIVFEKKSHCMALQAPRELKKKIHMEQPVTQVGNPERANQKAGCSS